MKRFFAVLIICVLIIMNFMVPVAHAEAIAIGTGVAALCAAVLGGAGVNFLVQQGGQTGFLDALNSSLTGWIASGNSGYSNIAGIQTEWNAAATIDPVDNAVLYVKQAVYNKIIAFRDWLIQDQSLTVNDQTIFDVRYLPMADGGRFNLSWISGDSFLYKGTAIIYSDPANIYTFANNSYITASTTYMKMEVFNRFGQLKQTFSGSNPIASYLVYDSANSRFIRYIEREENGNVVLSNTGYFNSSILLDGLNIAGSVVSASYDSAAATVLQPAAGESVQLDIPGAAEYDDDIDVTAAILDLLLSGDLTVNQSLVADQNVPNDPLPDSPSTDLPGYVVPGLSEIFPFCIPFDIYNFLTLLDANREAPDIVFPLDFGPVGQFELEFDFSEFDNFAAVFRKIELLGFIVGLAWATKKLIGSGGG